MTLPNNAKDLINPTDCLFERWDAQYGLTRWFRVRGMSECLDAIGREMKARDPDISNITISTICSKTYATAGIAAAKDKEWPKELEIGEWHKLSKPQIRAAKKHEALRFDKGALVVATMHEAAAKLAPGFDVFDFPLRDDDPDQRGCLSLDPAIHLINGFDHNSYNALMQTELSGGGRAIDALCAETGQDNPRVFWELSKNRRCTHALVDGTIEFMKRHRIDGAASLEIERVSDRVLETGNKTPNNLERVWLTADRRQKPREHRHSTRVELPKGGSNRDAAA